MIEVCLEVKNIKKGYGNFTLGEISYSFEKGKWYYIQGDNGSGKTTFLNLISNYIFPDAGDILFWGKRMEGNEIYIKNRLSFIPNYVPLPQHLSPKLLSDLYRNMYNRFDRNLFRKILKELGINEKNCKIAEMSDGMKKKVFVALEISYYPEIMLIDEMSNDLDRTTVPFLFDLLDDLVRSNKTTIIMTSHINIDIIKREPIIIIMNEGKLQKYSLKLDS